MPNSKSMAPERARIPHLARGTSEVGDLRADVDDSFERFERLLELLRIRIRAQRVGALDNDGANAVLAGSESSSP